MKKLSILMVSLFALLFISTLSFAHSKDLDKEWLFLGETDDAIAYININSLEPKGEGIMSYVGVITLKIKSHNSLYEQFKPALKEGQFPAEIFSYNYADCRNDRFQTTAFIVKGYDANDEDIQEKVLMQDAREFSDDNWMKVNPATRAKELICGKPN